MNKSNRSGWDCSQMSEEDVLTVARILRHRSSRLIVSDGLDAENEALSAIAPGLYEDISKPEPSAPSVPDDYREKKAVRIAKSAGLLVLASCAAAWLAQAIFHGVNNIIIYVILAAWVALLGSLARR